MRIPISISAALLLVSGTAHAYVIQTSDSGAELHFTAMPQYFYLNDAGSADIADDSDLDAVRSAFASWSLVEHSDARFTRLDNTNRGLDDVFNDGGMAGRDQLNLVVWVENGWIESPSQIAVTYTYFIDSSGKILEDDITMNGEDYTWTAGDTVVLTDVEAIAAHEIGHAFGLGHSIDGDATMFASASVGETKKRDLAQDDKDAIIYLYPPGCCKRHAGDDLLAALGCSVTSVDAAPAVSLALLAIAGMLCWRRKRSASIGLFFVLAISAPAEASVAREMPLPQLVDASEAVVRGRVIWQETTEGAKGSIVTITQIEVDDVLAGSAGSMITIVEPGGVAPSGIGLHVSGAARYELGEEVVVFAERPRGAYATNFPDALRTTAMAQGKLRVVRENGVARVERDLSGVVRMSEKDGWITLDPLHGTSLEMLELLIKTPVVELKPGCADTLKLVTP